MSKKVSPSHRKSNSCGTLAMMLIAACLLLPPAVLLAIDHPTSNPYEARPVPPDGNLPYRIIPTPGGILTEKDVMVTMPDGVKLACNIFRPEKPGKFPVILAMTPYGKDLTPPVFNQDGSYLPGIYAPYIEKVYAQVTDVGQIRISMLTTWEGPDPAFWVPNDYAIMIVDVRGAFRSGGKISSPFQGADDLSHLIEWAATQPWSNSNVGMIGVSALASNQYYAASRQPAPPHLKAIIPWESQSDRYRDTMFWGGIPETNFSLSLGPFKANLQKMPLGEAAKVWAAAMDPVGNQKMLKENPRLENITVPALICASWSDKGLHTRGTFEVWRRAASKDKWLYTHGGKKWEQFYSEDAVAYQKKFFDHYLKGEENGWQNTPRVRLEVRETRDEYTVRFEKEFPLARTKYQKLYLNFRDASLSPRPVKQGKAVYSSTQGGEASFAITFDEETELTGFMKAKLWVSAKDADDMDLFVVVKKFAGPCDVDTPLCNELEAVVGKGSIAKGNEIQFRGMNGYFSDVAARGQMRVSQRELDPVLSAPWQPVQKFQGEKKLKPGEIVPVEIAILPSSTLFRKGETLRLSIQGYSPVSGHKVVFNDWLINKGRHIIYTGGKYDSYLEIPVIPR